jgi:hypothetical protein
MHLYISSVGTRVISALLALGGAHITVKDPEVFENHRSRGPLDVLWDTRDPAYVC